MLSENLILEVEKLNRIEKLHLMQLLVSQLEHEELLTATEYEVWSPYDSAGAAAILTQLLEEDRQQDE